MRFDACVIFKDYLKNYVQNGVTIRFHILYVTLFWIIVVVAVPEDDASVETRWTIMYFKFES